MAQLGRLSRVFQDNQGRPIVGLAITIRKQGSTINGLHSGAQTSFTVNDPGGITDSPADQLQVGTDTSVTRAVSSVAATNVTVGAGGFSNVADDARLTPTTNLPTVYNDAQGGETITQPLSTDANGSIECWAPIVPYDLYTPGNANYAARLIQDVVPEGQEAVVSNIFPSATSVAFQKDTLRAQISGSKLERWLSAGVEKFYIDLNASMEARLSSHHVVGPLTIDSGGIVITLNDLTFGAAASRIIPGATSLALRNHANSEDNLLVSDAGLVTARAGLVATTGDIVASGSPGRFSQTGTGTNVFQGAFASALDVTGRRLVASGTSAVAAGDWALSGGFGATTPKAVTAAKDAHGLLTIGPTSGGGYGSNPTATLTFKDGNWSAGLHAFAVRGSGGNQTTVPFTVTTINTTTLVLTFAGTVGAGETYEVYWLVIG